MLNINHKTPQDIIIHNINNTANTLYIHDNCHLLYLISTIFISIYFNLHTYGYNIFRPKISPYTRFYNSDGIETDISIYNILQIIFCICTFFLHHHISLKKKVFGFYQKFSLLTFICAPDLSQLIEYSILSNINLKEIDLVHCRYISVFVNYIILFWQVTHCHSCATNSFLHIYATVLIQYHCILLPRHFQRTHKVRTNFYTKIYATTRVPRGDTQYAQMTS